MSSTTSTYFCVLTIRKHLLKMRFERSGRGQEPSRGHKFSILENFLPLWDSFLLGRACPKPCLERTRRNCVNLTQFLQLIERNRVFPTGNALLYISLLSVVFGRVRPIQGRTLFLFLWKLMLFHHLLQDVCHIILVDAGSFIVLHVCVLSALRHLYSCDFCYTVLLIRFWTHSRREGAFILLSEENKKSEPFSYRKKVRILLLWCTSRDSNPGPTD